MLNRCGVLPIWLAPIRGSHGQVDVADFPHKWMPLEGSACLCVAEDHGRLLFETASPNGFPEVPEVSAHLPLEMYQVMAALRDMALYIRRDLPRWLRDHGLRLFGLYEALPPSDRPLGVTYLALALGPEMLQHLQSP